MPEERMMEKKEVTKAVSKFSGVERKVVSGTAVSPIFNDGEQR